MGWFRFYDDAMQHPKVAALSDSDIRLWLAVLCVANRNGGVIPGLGVLKEVLKTRLDHLSRALKRLIDAGLIDPLEDGYSPHNWGKRQYKSDSSRERVKTHRKKCNGDVTFHVTAPEQNRTEAEKKDKNSVPNGTANFETFRQAKSRLDLGNSGSPKSVAEMVLPDPKTEYFLRGRQVLGRQSGGLLAKLLRHFGREDDVKTIAHARAAIEHASTKAVPVEWIGRVIAGQPSNDDVDKFTRTLL